MSSILDMLSSQLGGNAVGQISDQLGADKDTTGAALSSALPMLLGALKRNSQDGEAAGALSQALEKDHDGSIFDDLSGHLANPSAQNGGGILGHLLGSKRGAVEQGLSKVTGLESDKVGQLLEMAAPLVMGALGKQKREKGLSSGGLAEMLGQEADSVEQKAPGAGSLLTSLLDADGDGDVKDDVAKLGKNLLGKLFGG